MSKLATQESTGSFSTYVAVEAKARQASVGGVTIVLPLSRHEACQLPKVWARPQILSMYKIITNDQRTGVQYASALEVVCGAVQEAWWTAYVGTPFPESFTRHQAERLAAAKAATEKEQEMAEESKKKPAGKKPAGKKPAGKKPAGNGGKRHGTFAAMGIENLTGDNPYRPGSQAHQVREWSKALKTASGVLDRKSTRLNSSHIQKSRMPSSA